MAHKHDSQASAHSSVPSFSHGHPLVSPSDKLLSAVISLPVDPRVVVATYVPDSDSPSYDVLEHGRRSLVSRNRSLSFHDSIFPYTHVDGESSALHAFMITSEAATDACLSTLQSLPMDGLKRSELLSFDSRCLYPCSSACAEQSSPCNECLDLSPCLPSASGFSAANLLPRKPLRTFYSRFLDAIRTRLINDITEASKDPTTGSSAHRLMNGLLLASSPCSNEWGADWLHQAKLRPLVHCQLEVHLDSSRLEVYTHFRPTDFLPLDTTLLLPPGTPITLLPFGVPAYFLSKYTGPTSAVTSQFEQSLSGLGAGEWKSCSTTPLSEKQKRSRLNTQRQHSPVYIIAWLAVQNKQGEDKGMPIIWPSRLSISFTSTSQHCAHARRALSHIPDLPPQLQPSPPLPTLSSVSTDSPSDHGNGLVVPSTPVLTGHSLSRRVSASPTSDSLRAFRYMTLSKSSTIDTVASEISSYIESVAKEREKERERIRREREAQLSASPKIATTPIAVPVNVPMSTNTLTASTTPAGPTAAALSTPEGASQTLAALTPDTNPPSVNAPYPSPPATNSKPTIQLVDSETPVSDAEPPPPDVQPEPSMPYSSAFDDFDAMDTSWSQPASELMNMSMGYDMPFDMNVDAITGGGGGGNGGGSQMNMDFEDGFTITEDDFDFFDRPSGTTATGSSRPPPGATKPTVGPGALRLPAVALNGSHAHGVPVVVQNISNASPAPAIAGIDAFTPRFPDSPTVDLIPTTADPLPSPVITPYAQSVPATPQSQQLKLPAASSTFDPIPFAHRHRLSDSKYDMGKFALPSPPDEEDRTEPLPLASPARVKGWKQRYSAATDPRVGVVRRLIGVKRKCLDQGRPRRPRPSWLDDYDNSQGDPEGAFADRDDADSDGASDSDEPDGGDHDAPSRPTTPPPAYLPHGASLLHMQFHHTYLLPLSKPLRPPGAAVAPMTIPSVVPASVPTPVSPAAALGAASEKSKSLEAAGSMIAREVVENPVFAKAWRASKLHTLSSRQADIWPADVAALAAIIRGVHVLDGPIELQSLLSQVDSEQSAIRRLEPPMLSVGKGECIVQLLPPSLRFWRKLGLAPCGGRKDITAYLLFEEHGPLKQQTVETWLQKMSSVYNAYHLGAHSLGTHSLCTANGILPLRFDSLRKSFVSFIPGLPDGAIVIYIALPDSSLSLASPLLRQILSTVKRIQKMFADRPILFQFIPEPLIVAHDLGDKDTDFEALSFSVYQRLAQPVDRTMSRKIIETGEKTQAYFQEPLFILSRSISPTVSFSQAGQPRTLDVLDRHTFLHVGYRFSSCGKWLLAACVDQRGESYDIGSWLTRDEVETSAVIQVWNFAAQFARRANIEWRLVITKLGVMSASELDAWIHHLSATIPLCRDLPPMHISIVSADHSTSWSLLQDHRSNVDNQTLPRRVPNKDTSKATYVDITTATTYFIHPAIRIPLPAPPTRRWVDTSFVPDNEGTPISDTLPLLPISTTILLHTAARQAGAVYPTLHVHLLHTLQTPGSMTNSNDTIHQEVTLNYHELTVLARVRGQGSDDYPLLPLHLAALEIMHDALRQEDTE